MKTTLLVLALLILIACDKPIIQSDIHGCFAKENNVIINGELVALENHMGHGFEEECCCCTIDIRYFVCICNCQDDLEKILFSKI